MTPSTAEGMIFEALLVGVQAMVLSPVMTWAAPGVPFSEPDSRKFLRVQLMPNRPVRPFIGSSEPTLHMGVLQIMVVWPLAQGELQARELAGQVADYFDTDTVWPYGSTVRVRVRKHPEVAASMPDPKMSGDLLTPVSVEYESYI